MSTSRMQTLTASVLQTREMLAQQGIDWQDTLDMYQSAEEYCDVRQLALLRC